MPDYVCDRIENLFNKKNIQTSTSNILLLGITFKENCTDSRNSKIVDIYNIFKNKNAKVDVYDPVAIKSDVYKYFGITLLEYDVIKNRQYDCVIIGVPHKNFRDIDIESLLKKVSVVFDVKGAYDSKYERL
jgi:UDP-N-acetyl-D-galactosamine dehydrogenase